MELFHRKDRDKEAFWVLKDVNFAVEPGEVVGIIGPNGAGKSTILKLISRIIEPTSGQVSVQGRVGALLELGAGFHPDLTGRENIYLNGSLLGLSREEISHKLEAIIDFAELETFIDVPVKHYSSGMYVRLGFSVAVHTEPEILLVDEVLAVGDAAFQRKCLGKVDALHQQGVTIVLVSHTLQTVRDACQRVLWLDQSSVVADGPGGEVIEQYLWSTYHGDGDQFVEGGRWGTGKVEVTQVVLLGAGGQKQDVFMTGEPLTFEIHYLAHDRVKRPVFGLGIHRGDGVHITGPNTRLAGCEVPSLEPGDKGILRYRVERLPLLPAMYQLSISAHDWVETEMFDYHDRSYPFYVTGGQVREHHGLVTLFGRWATP